MSSYSQGALVVRSTAPSLPAETMAKINSVLPFGDLRNRAAITRAEGKILTVCHENDAMCSGGFVAVERLACIEDAGTAARFVIQEAQGERTPWSIETLHASRLTRT